jgi:hypothetical protein
VAVVPRRQPRSPCHPKRRRCCAPHSPASDSEQCAFPAAAHSSWMRLRRGRLTLRRSWPRAASATASTRHCRTPRCRRSRLRAASPIERHRSYGTSVQPASLRRTARRDVSSSRRAKRWAELHDGLTRGRVARPPVVFRTVQAHGRGEMGNSEQLTAREKTGVAVAGDARARKLALEAGSDELPIGLRADRQLPLLACVEVVEA